MRLLISLLFLSSILAAQTGGVTPDWEVRATAAALEKNAAAAETLLAQLKPQEWIREGAPAAYVEQLQQARQVHSYLAQEAQTLARSPEKLTVVVDAFLRLDHAQSLLDSLAGGARKYQNAALADLLSSLISRNSAARERLKEYTRQLVIEREQEWEVAHREAQRCRESLAKGEKKGK